jgi:hypothetical protein
MSKTNRPMTEEERQELLADLLKERFGDTKPKPQVKQES